MIKREHYIKEVREFYDSNLIKIITGIRRSGKSVILGQIKAEIQQKSDNIIYLNFENKSTQLSISNANSIIEYVRQERKEGLCYVFLDELQVIDDWAEACKTLRLENCSLFITGSNSKLLSSEFAKQLSGRFIAFRVRPFVYKEIIEYSKELGIEATIMDYLIYGGFPNRFEFRTKEAQIKYLNDLDETIVINDLITRYKIKKTELFKRLVNFVLKSNSRIFSAKSIYDYVNKNIMNCSINTIMKYLDHLKEAYVIDTINQYSTKVKRELEFYVKIYDADVALNSIRCLDNRFDLTHNLENIIYNELLYMGYKINVFDNNGKEIDFIASKGNMKYLVQVAYSVAEDKAYNREFEAFYNLDNSMQKVLITNDEIDYSTSTVRHIKLKDFLLMNRL